MQHFNTTSQTLRLQLKRPVTDADMRPYYIEFCSRSTPLGSKLTSTFGASDCHHNLGHAMMAIANYDVVRAISNCKTADFQIMQYFCATGAYHQFALAKSFIQLPQNSTWLYPCDTMNDYPAACYRPCFLYNDKKVMSSKSRIDMALTCLNMENRAQRLG